MKIKEFRSVQKLNFRTEKLARACNVEKQGCFPRLKNFSLPEYETERKLGRVNPRTEDAHYVQPQTLLIWGARLGQQSCSLSLKPTKASHWIKEAGSVSRFSKSFDRAPHNRPVGQMTNCGLVHCVINGLSNRKQIISVQSCVTIVMLNSTCLKGNPWHLPFSIMFICSLWGFMKRLLEEKRQHFLSSGFSLPSPPWDAADRLNSYAKAHATTLYIPISYYRDNTHLPGCDFTSAASSCHFRTWCAKWSRRNTEHHVSGAVPQMIFQNDLERNDKVPLKFMHTAKTEEQHKLWKMASDFSRSHVYTQACKMWSQEYKITCF